MRHYLRRDIKARFPWSNTWLLKLESQGRFPRRFYLGEKTPAWDADKVDALVVERAAQTEAA